MNERIKALIAQTRLQYNTQQTTTERTEELNKFVELIVKECITMIEQDRFRRAYLLDTEYDDGYVDGLSKAELVLKEHFGIQ